MDYKFYKQNGITFLELHNEPMLTKIMCDIDEVDYEQKINDAIKKFKTKFKDVHVGLCGPNNDHVCVEDTPANRERYQDMVKYAITLVKEIVDYFSEFRIFSDGDLSSVYYNYNEISVMYALGASGQTEGLEHYDLATITEAVWRIWCEECFEEDIDDITDNRYELYPWLKFENEAEKKDLKKYAERTVPDFIRLYKETVKKPPVEEKHIVQIPVHWVMGGFVEVEAGSIEEAIEIAVEKENGENPFSLPDGTYLDDSFNLPCDINVVAEYNEGVKRYKDDRKNEVKRKS